MRVAGVWQDDRRFGLQVRVGDRRAAAAVRRRGAAGLPQARAPRRRRRAAARAARALRRGRARRDRPRPARARSAPRGSTRGARRRRSARGTRCAPRGRCTCCSRRTGSPGSSRGSPQHYGDRAHQVVRERPYELTSVFGVGFRTADTIARAGGAGPTSPARTRAGVVHVLAEAERDGSTCLPVARARRAARPSCSARRRRTPPCCARWPTTSELVLEVDGAGAVWAYRPEVAALEAELAEQVRALAGGKAAAAGAGASRRTSARSCPAPEQWAAVRAGFASRLSVVTGGPGTGKTATIRLLCAAAAAQQASVALVAPDGPRRAAHGRVDRRRGLDDPRRARLGPGPGADARRARDRPADRRRDVDGEPRAARDAAAGRRPAHARRARRRRRPARARRRRQAVRGAGGGGRRARSPSSRTSSARRRGA